MKKTAIHGTILRDIFKCLTISVFANLQKVLFGAIFILISSLTQDIRAQGNIIASWTFNNTPTTGICRGGDVIDSTVISRYSAHTQTAYSSTWHRHTDTTAAYWAAQSRNYPVWNSYFYAGLGDVNGFHFNSPTVHDGYMVMSMLEFIPSWGGHGNVGGFNAYMKFGPINTTNASQISIRFYQYYRKFNFDQCWIDYSTDSNTWNTIEINVKNVDIAVNETCRGWVRASLPISVAHQASVYFRIRWSCESYEDAGGAYGFFWAIDDVTAIDGPVYDFSAIAPSGQTLYYNIVDNYAQVTKQCFPLPYYSNYPTGMLIIPDSVTHNGTTYMVKSIDNTAFYDCSGLTSLTIPNSVTFVGNYALYGCRGLTSLTIPNAVSSIGQYAFQNCCNLTSVSFNADSCTIIRGYSRFEGDTNITNFTFGDNVRIIPPYLCPGLSGLSSITIPNSVTSIGAGAFHGCTGLNSVTIGNSVTSIGEYAFSGCSDLTTMWIKPSIPPSLGNNRSLSDSVIDVVVPHNYYDTYTNAGPIYTRHRIYGDTAIVTITINDTARGYGYDTIISYPYPDTINIPAPRPKYGYHFARWGGILVGLMRDTTVTAYFDKNQYVVNATSDTAIHGSIRTNSLREYLDIVSVEACPNHGYHFTHWQDGDTTNPRTFTLTQDTHFVAYYGKNIYTLSFISNNDNIGVVDTTSVSGEYLDTTGLIHAIAVPHHHFVRWNDNNTDDPRRFVIDDNHTYMAYFAIDTYSVAVVSSDIVRGSVTGGGTFVYGTPCIVEATAYTGYTFHSWSNGVTANPYTFAVLNDMTLTAIFLAPGEETHTVTVSVNDPTMGTATVNGNTSATVMNGETVTLLATPNVGYRFVKWSDENTEASRTVTVTGDMSFTATFVSTQGIEDVVSANLNIYAKDGRICVTLNGQTTDEFSVYDVMGRRAAHVIASDKSPVLPAGVYIVKVGTLPARKVVVIR